MKTCLIFLAGMSLLLACQKSEPEAGSRPAAVAVAARAPATPARPEHDAWALSVHLAGPAGVGAGDRVDVLGAFPDPAGKDGLLCVTVAADAIVLDVQARGEVTRVLLGLATARDLRRVSLADGAGAVGLMRRNPTERGEQEEQARASLASLAGGERILALERIRQHRAGGPGPSAPRAKDAPLIPKGLRALAIPARGAWAVQPGDRVDVLGTFPDPAGGPGRTNTLVAHALRVLASDPERATLLVLAGEAELLFLASQLGTLHLAIQGSGADQLEPDREALPTEELLRGEMRKRLPRGQRILQIVETEPGQSP